MPAGLSDAEFGKYLSAKAAMAYVKPGMKLGLGTGSTAAWFVKILAAHVRGGLDVRAASTSNVTADLARALGMKIEALDDLGQLDLAVDGADEFDPDLNLIKGGGGALLIEKIVERAADQFVVITDASKEVETLGAFSLPLEIIQYGWATTQRQIEALLARSDVDGHTVTRRTSPSSEGPYVSDEGHYIFDLGLGRIGDAVALHSALVDLPGVVETGLFLGMADTVVMGRADGVILSKTRGASDWTEEAIDMAAAEAEIAALLKG